MTTRKIGEFVLSMVKVSFSIFIVWTLYYLGGV